MFGAASVMMESAEAGQSSGLPVIGPEAVMMTLEVNGERRAVQVEPRMTLADSLAPIGRDIAARKPDPHQRLSQSRRSAA